MAEKGAMSVNEERNARKRARKRKGSEKFRFSLRSMEIRLLVFIGAKDKVHLCDESYAWVQKSWSFVKLNDVGNFPTLNIFSLKAM